MSDEDQCWCGTMELQGGDDPECPIHGLAARLKKHEDWKSEQERLYPEPTLTVSSRPPKTMRTHQCHNRWRRRLGPALKDIEHFRGEYLPLMEHCDGNGHRDTHVGDTRYALNVAAVVLHNGSVYFGVARQNYKDPYSRKIGFKIAVGRALKCAAREDTIADTTVPKHLGGVELRDAVRNLIRAGQCIDLDECATFKLYQRRKEET